MDSNFLKNPRTFFLYLRHGVKDRIVGFLKKSRPQVKYINPFDSLNLPKDIDIIQTYSSLSLDSIPSINTDPDIIFSKPSNLRFMFNVENAVVDSISARIYDSRGVFLGDSSPWSYLRAVDRFPANPLKKLKVFSQQKKINGLSTFFPSQTYFHWVTEDLPAFLRIYEKFPRVRVLVPASRNSFVDNFLDSESIKFEISPGYFLAENLIYESRSAALVPHSIDVSTLRNYSGNLVPRPNAKNIIYVSRRDVGRIPLNELEVEEIINEFGIEQVTLTGMNFLDQIKLFASSFCVIGTHGAGLANIVWSHNPNCTLIEIRKSSQSKCYERLTRQLDFGYIPVETFSENWVTDVELLRARIKSIINY